MTNAEKYLKDGVSAEEFVKAVWGNCYNIPEAEGDRNYKDCFMYGANVERWLNEQAKPTLTEDERVILGNLNKEYIFIGKKDKFLYIKADKEKEDYFAGNVRGLDIIFPNLFQFIKERRRISNKGVTK